MEIVIRPTAEAAVAAAADRVVALLAAKPQAVLGLATGETMRPFYARLVGLHAEGRVSFARASVFALDEYAGLAPEHPASFHAYLRAALLDAVALPPERENLLRGDAPDPAAEAARYEALIRAAGGVDLQVLGIGRNGHLAFNEPGSPLDSRTRLVALADETLQANAAAFAPEPCPREAITLGLGTILEARACLLLAVGRSKAPAIAAAAEGPVGPDCPASALRRHHAATLILDAEAASGLSPARLRGAVAG